MAQKNKRDSALSIFRPDSSLFTLCLAAILTFSIWQLVAFVSHQSAANESDAASSNGAALNAAAAPLQADPQAVWVATAPGRVKPKGGEIHIRPEVRGVIRQILVEVKERVKRGDIVALIDEEQALARLAAARAEVQVRLAERAEEPTQGLAAKILDWRNALDNVAAAERQLHSARHNFDVLLLERHAGNKIPHFKIEAARKEIATAEADIIAKRRILDKIENKPNSPSSTRLDSGLAIARADLRLAEIAYEQTRIRAAIDGIVLQLGIKPGEIANPASLNPAAIVGNLDKLEVAAEIEERTIDKIREDQLVEIRSNAFDGAKYLGKVIRLAPRVNLPALGLRGSNEPRDIEVLEVDIAIEGTPPLLPGMRVDVYFAPFEPTKQAATN